jgi:hypothetical protein
MELYCRLDPNLGTNFIKFVTFLMNLIILFNLCFI